MLGRKLHSGTFRKKGKSVWTGASSFVLKVHCVTCVLAWLIPYHVTGLSEGAMRKERGDLGPRSSSTRPNSPRFSTTYLCVMSAYSWGTDSGAHWALKLAIRVFRVFNVPSLHATFWIVKITNLAREILTYQWKIGQQFKSSTQNLGGWQMVNSRVEMTILTTFQRIWDH